MGKDLRTSLDKVKEVEDAGGIFKESGYVEVGRPVNTGRIDSDRRNESGATATLRLRAARSPRCHPR